MHLSPTRLQRGASLVVVAARALYDPHKYPNSEVVVRDLRNGERTEIKYKSELGPDGKTRNDETKALNDAGREEIGRLPHTNTARSYRQLPPRVQLDLDGSRRVM
jgi:hypothetical protein